MRVLRLHPSAQSFCIFLVILFLLLTRIRRIISRHVAQLVTQSMWEISIRSGGRVLGDRNNGNFIPPIFDYLLCQFLHNVSVHIDGQLDLRICRGMCKWQQYRILIDLLSHNVRTHIICSAQHINPSQTYPSSQTLSARKNSSHQTFCTPPDV